MRLVIGGSAQGKLALTLAQTGFAPDDVCDGALCDLGQIPEKPIINRLHLLIRRLMEAGQEPRIAVECIARANPDIIFITDEIGYGVVPVDRFEREWREATGRICCELAQKSVRVERVFAGISMIIKGD
ncbi:bifunctional adenosylcobinamide kinase/adenosylcobinamide-phosphate guanylyltransferase [Oscillospiraceae bacterium PP1C4]